MLNRERNNKHMLFLMETPLEKGHPTPQMLRSELASWTVPMLG